MNASRRSPGRGGCRLAWWILAALPDERDRAEVLADFEELRRTGGHGRAWYWREVVRLGWALRTGGARARLSRGRSTRERKAGGELAGSVLADLRYALRGLGRSPGLTFVAIPTIALAVGATTALFSFADALLLRPLPVRDADRLLALHHVATEGPASFSSFSYPDYLDLRDASRTTDGVAAFASVELRLGEGADAEPVEALIVSGNYFTVLGAPPAVGRAFLPEEDRTSGTHPVVVLSQGLLDRRFGGDRSIVGRSITLNGRPFTVVGVAAPDTPSLDLTARPELWVPLMMHEVALPRFRAFGTSLFDNRGTHWLDLIARLASGVDARAAVAELRELARRQAEEHPTTNRGWSITAVPAASSRLGPPSAQPLVRLTALLAAVVSMVLLIACANVANLLLSRAAARRQEMAVRVSLGASRTRLLRQVLTEALLLAALGGGAGVLLAVGCMRLLPGLDLSSSLVGLDVRLDARVLAVAGVATLGTGVLFGIAPGLTASAAGVTRAGRWAVGWGGRRPIMRQLLVAAQVALALVLLVGAGLTLRTLLNLGRVPLGFDARNLVIAPVDLTEMDGSDAERLVIYARAAERVRAIPGVRDVALARISPFSSSRMANDILWEGGDSTGGRARSNVDMNVVDVGYFRTLGIPVVAGRAITEEDRLGAPDVAVLNKALADHLWPGESPIGKRIWSPGRDGPDRALEVVGVVANGRYYRSWRTADRPFVFLPLAQNASPEMTLHVRTSGTVRGIEDSLRGALADASAAIPPPRTRTAEAALAASISVQSTNARLFLLFGGLATVIAAVGVYGVVSFTVGQRIPEIAIRMALGARPLDVRRMILVGSARPILAGSALGLLAAGALTRFLAPLLFGVGLRDPTTFLIVPLALVVVGLLASHIPARRATRVDPQSILRE